MDRALLWLHEQEIIRLGKGLAVFRPAMTIHLGQDRRGFMKADFEPLKIHYDSRHCKSMSWRSMRSGAFRPWPRPCIWPWTTSA